ncbi:transposable element Tcb2 transposase [Trichonephila clavipes]|nr:transposable element Tcb2 transposase [Trichonephila clavipes]
MSFTRRPGSGCPQQTNRLEDLHIVRNARVQQTASSAAIQAQVAPSLGDPVSSRIVQRRLSEGHLGSRHPLPVLPLTPTHRRLRLEWCVHEETGLQRNGTRSSLATRARESRFNLSSDDVRVWRPHGECLIPAFALQRHTAHTAGVMVWGAIACSTRSPLALIHGTMTAQRHQIQKWDLELVAKSRNGKGCGSPVVKVSRHVMSSIPVPLKTRRVGQRCTLNLSRAETSSRWCGVVVRRGGASSGVVHVT